MMPLTTGTHLGPYEIVSPLGSGGMGEVYRARDPRMGREVAIKISAERFSDRFEREVHAVAALNHPNICHLYDVGPNYLVMELVEGCTLAERIASGAIPLGEALPIARQIAEALEAAHERGIIHRDLKPANVKITPVGVVKVLDFGLAKLADPIAMGEADATRTMQQATAVGLILGTAGYMSPEQASGKLVDKRADVWSFGVVLWEMLSGKRLFDGETASHTLAAVLTKQPDWSQLPGGTPAGIRRLLRRCLERDRTKRLPDIGSARLEIDDAAAEVETEQAPSSVTGLRRKLPWVAASLLAIALAIALWAGWRGSISSIEHPPVRLDIDLGSDISLGSSTGPAVILSPDGTRLVFISQAPDGTRRLFTRRLDQPKAALVSGTEGAYAPFFSPDGQWVGFFALGKLKKTRLDGGEPVSLCDAPSARGGSWGEDGNIIAALDGLAGLSRIPSEGGNAVAVTTLAPGENTHRWPQILAGGKAVLFNASIAYGNYDEAGISVVSLKDHSRKTLFAHKGMYPRYLPSGHLVYVTKGALFAMPFNLDRLEAQGAATLLQEVSSNPNLGFAQLDFSSTGTLAYRTGLSEGLRTALWLDGAGKTESLGTQPAFYLFPRLSPDGGRLALLVSQGENTDLWIYDLQQGRKTRLTNGLEDTAYPVWSPDGQFVVFHSAQGIYWTRADGAGKPQPLTHSKNMQLPTSFTPDGARLLFSELSGARKRDPNHAGREGIGPDARRRAAVVPHDSDRQCIRGLLTRRKMDRLWGR
jgi:Serine/threonine protein kinase